MRTKHLAPQLKTTRAGTGAALGRPKATGSCFNSELAVSATWRDPTSSPASRQASQRTPKQKQRREHCRVATRPRRPREDSPGPRAGSSSSCPEGACGPLSTRAQRGTRGSGLLRGGTSPSATRA
eukprot:Amastigsp_a14774_12.p4 type:complete len:125 gc:universal Amastigsp_a14774_12:694-320(-)